MTLSHWCSEIIKVYHQHDIRTAGNAAFQELWQGILKRVFSKLNYRPTVWDREWDTLVILDACRADALEQAVDQHQQYPSSDAVDQVVSPSSTSSEFMRTQFLNGPSDELANTALICANAHTKFFVNRDDWEYIEEVWKRELPDDQLSEVAPPRYVTDLAIDAHRELDVDRMIVWYIQPHFPSRELNETNVFKKIRDGKIAREDAWDAYMDNVEWVLNDVDHLLKNINAETVAITSDHGDSFGEYGVYGHAPNIPIPQLKKVPWLTVSAGDTGGYTPTIRLKDTVETSTDVNKHLEALGYK